MHTIDNPRRRRNPNALRLRNVVIVSLIALGLLACSDVVATATLTPPLPLGGAPAQPYADNGPLDVITPDPTMPLPTDTPVLPPTELPQIPHAMPPEWPNGVDAMTVNRDNIIEFVTQYPDQKGLAEANFSQEYLQSLVLFKFHHLDEAGEKKLWGGTGTVVAQDNNFTYVLTATHVAMPAYPVDLTVSSPFSGTDQQINTGDVAVFASQEEGRGDISIARIPKINTLGAFTTFNTDYCVAGQPLPQPGELITFVGFPYLSTINAYTPVVAGGAVDAVSTTCWYQDNPTTLFLATNNPAIPGDSGALMLNAQGQGIAVESAVSPNGAQGIPLGPNTIPTLLNTAGYVAP